MSERFEQARSRREAWKNARPDSARRRPEMDVENPPVQPTSAKRRTRELEKSFASSAGGSKRPSFAGKSKSSAKQRKRELEHKYGSSPAGMMIGEGSISINDFHQSFQSAQSDASLSLGDLQKSSSVDGGSSRDGTGTASKRKSRKGKKKKGAKNNNDVSSGGIPTTSTAGTSKSSLEESVERGRRIARANSNRSGGVAPNSSRRGRSISVEQFENSINNRSMSSDLHNSRSRGMDRSASRRGPPPPPDFHQSRSFERAASRPDMNRSRSFDGSKSFNGMMSRSDFDRSKSLDRANSRPQMARGMSGYSGMSQMNRSGHRSMANSFHDSRADMTASGHQQREMFARQGTMGRSTASGLMAAGGPSRRDMMVRQGTMARSTASGMTGSRRDMFARQGTMARSTASGMMGRSTRTGLTTSKSKKLEARKRYLKKKREQIKPPPKSLVIIWIVVGLELILDLVTTIISYIALVGDDTCCDQQIDLGPLPLAITTPFFILIVAELAFLVRAIRLTLFPVPRKTDEEQAALDLARPLWRRIFCKCMRWNAQTIMMMINFLVLVNPFFGAVVAWMLLYQSSKVESFVVLALEGASLFLHFFSIYLEAEEQTIMSLMFHCIPVVPFLVSVIVIFIYLNQGGVCYLVEDSLFWYEGCQVCPDGLPPTDDNMCRAYDENGMITLVEATKDLLKFGEYCSEDRNFCFFEY